MRRATAADDSGARVCDYYYYYCYCIEVFKYLDEQIVIAKAAGADLLLTGNS